MKSEEADHAAWFSQEVQVHTPSLRAYLRGAFPSLVDVEDVIQESLMKLWRVGRADTVRSGKALLFTTARNTAIDLHRRRVGGPLESVADPSRLEVSGEETAVPEAVSRAQELEILAEAIRSLPDRCRQVLTLRKIYGLSQREIAARMGISENTVETQVANGMRRCAEFLERRGVREEMAR
jgi:RNA polymerase sigma-70 factor (ECF subfamily)